MTVYDDYRNTDYLDDISFIAGTDFIINFPVYDNVTTKNPVDINSSSMKWLLSPYGQPEYCVLEKTATISGSSTFVVTITSRDSSVLGGVYLQQMQIIDSSGSKIRPAQGIVVIRKAIPVSGTQ